VVTQEAAIERGILEKIKVRLIWIVIKKFTSRLLRNGKKKRND